jgi:hypothetical protein
VGVRDFSVSQSIQHSSGEYLYISCTVTIECEVCYRSEHTVLSDSKKIIQTQIFSSHNSVFTKIRYMCRTIRLAKEGRTTIERGLPQYIFVAALSDDGLIVLHM